MPAPSYAPTSAIVRYHAQTSAVLWWMPAGILALSCAQIGEVRWRMPAPSYAYTSTIILAHQRGAVEDVSTILYVY